MFRQSLSKVNDEKDEFIGIYKSSWSITSQYAHQFLFSMSHVDLLDQQRNYNEINFLRLISKNKSNFVIIWTQIFLE